ncbi:MAG: ATP-binding cassette domain-containing protein [Spirochaetaceae bacterium]|nr:ATP-binding cassette domain-containing protein [Spirochaetaceae bacterium]
MSEHARPPARAAPRRREPAAGRDAEFLAVRGLRKYFPVRKGIFLRRVGEVKAVDGVSFAVDRGTTLGLVGESGCGKTTTARVIVHLEQPDSGRVIVDGTDTDGLAGAELRRFRTVAQMIFQDPYSSLNPHHSARRILGEPLLVHGLCTRAQLRERVAAILDRVNLSADFADRYPHELSGGQRQRLGIARAIALEPRLIVCDEPVSALDVSIRSQILNLLLDLQEELELTSLFVAHDLSVIEHVSDVIAVMYLGKIVETAPTDRFFAGTLHPYSEALLSAVPVPDPRVRKKRMVLAGDVPSPLAPPSGCRFRTRCPLADRRCAEEEPPLREVAPRHLLACHHRG